MTHNDVSIFITFNYSTNKAFSMHLHKLMSRADLVVSYKNNAASFCHAVLYASLKPYMFSPIHAIASLVTFTMQTFTPSSF